jgi:AraC-like DNA-binding protein
MDRISPIFNQLRPSAKVFFDGRLCDTASFQEGSSGHLHLLRSGAIELKGDSGSTCAISEPSIIFIANPFAHSLKPHRLGADIICANISFGNGIDNPILRSFPSSVVIPLSSALSLAPTLEIVFHEASSRHCAKQIALNRLLEYLLVLLFRYVIERQILSESALLGLYDGRLGKAITAIHEHPYKTWSLELLAKQAGMSRTRFADLFKKTVGQTPMDYLTDWRISLAQNLLLAGKPIKHISTSLGYQNPSSFTRVFTKKIGQSPLHWQQINQYRQ